MLYILHLKAAKLVVRVTFGCSYRTFICLSFICRHRSSKALILHALPSTFPSFEPQYYIPGVGEGSELPLPTGGFYCVVRLIISLRPSML